jgi:5-phospho-D-xylono-1,4-lactonase
VTHSESRTPNPESRIIRTVLGDIPSSSLGLTLGHDHLYTLPPEDVTDPDLRMDSEEAAVQELELFKRAGGGAVVEMTTVDYGRDGAALARVSKASGIHVIAATGFNKGVFADRLTQHRGIEDIAAWMTREVNVGLERFSTAQPHEENATHVRAGLIKASSGLRDANENELKVFAAAIQAHRRTGAPISTHTEKGTWALEQALIFVDGAVNLERVLIGHLDLKPDLTYLLEVAATGARMGFDQFGKSKYLSDRSRVDLIVKLCEAGHSRQLILGGDMARKSYFKSYGGSPGLAHIPTTIRAMLEDALPLETVNDLLVCNARQWLEFSDQS